MADLLDKLARASDCRVLVVGDVMLDAYVWGDADRVSPEAPVPVVDVRRRSSTPGGAANAAVNAAHLGAAVRLVGVVGIDDSAEVLRAALQRLAVADQTLIGDRTRQTTTKTRVIAHHQQVARFDEESRADVAANIERAIVEAATEWLKVSDVCILSDYAKGVVTPAIASRVIAAARSAGVPVVVDPKGKDFEKYRGSTVITPNVHEAGRALGLDLQGTEDLLDGARGLMRSTGAAVLITRGAAGMSLFWTRTDQLSAEVNQLNVTSTARRVYDVTGAGDTVVAALAVALGCGMTLPEAARLANAAAGVVVAKIGTAGVTLEELRAAHAESGDGTRGGA